MIAGHATCTDRHKLGRAVRWDGQMMEGFSPSAPNEIEAVTQAPTQNRLTMRPMVIGTEM